MQWAKNRYTGFTIVELLIVIVVIAILAAITIVAYTGIQDRAKESNVQSDLWGLIYPRIFNDVIHVLGEFAGLDLQGNRGVKDPCPVKMDLGPGGVGYLRHLSSVLGG